MKFNGHNRTACKDEMNPATLSFGNITGFQIVVSVCHVPYVLMYKSNFSVNVFVNNL